MERYRIGDIDIIWEKDNFPLRQDEYMKKFFKSENEQMQDVVACKSYFADLNKCSSGKLLYKNGLYELYETKEGTIIVYHWATCRFAFGFRLEDLESEKGMTYYFHPDMKEQIPLDAVRFFSCAGMHSKLLQKGAVTFHAAYIEWKGKAILFAGCSGVGKTTQADLWGKYENARIINGDRTVIRQKEEVWKAYGSPCCGSSKICTNKTLPILAIVILEQGKTNEVKTLTTGEKLRALISGSEIYLWNKREVEQVCEIAEKIVQDICCLKLICRPEAEAVFVLKKALEEM